MSREPDKVRENRARRAVARRGFALQKSRRRDPRAWDYGTYQIIDPATNTMIYSAGDGYGLTLEAVERWLNS